MLNTALAQTPMLEEVYVPAQKRGESLQDVPVAVDVFNGFPEIGTAHQGETEGFPNMIPCIRLPSLQLNAVEI